ncbi:glutathione transferase GST 23-like [Olea europaea subsp. europaea]|uniref:Probable glutathione S-transferase n=1 Tax=Olea europaea subsp. europaea TaxID=158383 RepID=A0A8S0PYM9_OLEEU|nr:glutathione transferase GST 23-like [Olea europaea subsp. europaea]
MAEELKLFRTWSSPFALRIVHALKIKGLEYETIFEDLSNKSDSLLQYNPIHKKVPVLVHNGKPICESLVILEYVDETWKQCPLLSRDPYEKAKARFWAKFGDDKLFSSIWNVFTTQGKEQEEPIAAAVQNLKLIEELLKEKKFFGGETIGYLDIAFGWTANIISILEEIMNLNFVDEEKFPLLSAWMQNFSNDPVIKECWPPRDKMIVKFQVMREKYLKTVVSQ